MRHCGPVRRALLGTIGRMTALPDTVEPLGHGIYAIDTGFHRPRFDAAYLMVEDGRALFIDTGTNFALPRLLGALDALGVPREAVDHVIPTHVHLDHAGGVGALMAALPNATALVHPRGAPHMIDPGALIAGATAVYGPEEMARSYGEIVPVPAARVRETRDGMTLRFGRRELTFLDTPGHARHHHCIWDSASRGFFTGDTFGLSYREFDTAKGPWLMPSATPVQFEPQKLRASVERMLGFDPQVMYLTHYSAVRDVARLGAMFLEQLEAMVALGRASQQAADRQAALEKGLLDLYADRVAAHGCAFDRATVAELLAIDIGLNAQGMGIWLDREAKEAARA